MFSFFISNNSNPLSSKAGYTINGADLVYDTDNDPAIGGYFLFMFSDIPDYVLDSMALSKDYLSLLISKNIVSVELPTYSIAVTELQHGFGARTMIPLELSNSTSFQLNLYENQNGVMQKFFTEWQRVIAEEVTGLPIRAILDEKDDPVYKVNASLIILPPYIPIVASELKDYSPLFVNFYNIFPTNISYGSYGSDIQSNELITLNVTFAMDNFKILAPNFDDSEELNTLISQIQTFNAASENPDWFIMGMAESVASLIYNLFGRYII